MDERRNFLSKSSLQRGLQCQKSLYLNKFHPELRDPIHPQRQAIFNTGNEVGVLAQGLFPGGVDVSGENSLREQIDRTSRLVREGFPVIYEAAFCGDGVYCAVDILVKDGDTWRIFEVKSSTGISTTHVLDASIQYYVLRSLGLTIRDISIVTLNSQYVRGQTVALDELFSCTSVLTTVQERQTFVQENVHRLQAVLDQDSVPEIEIGLHCERPYTCDFKGHCWEKIPHPSIFDLGNVARKTRFALYALGVRKTSDIPPDYPLGKARMYVELENSGKQFVDREQLNKFLGSLGYPLYFLDFETISPAIPIFENTRPYQQIPFQYSLHYQETAQSPLKHFEFLAPAGPDPRRPFVERLIRDTMPPGQILVYYQAFEISRIKELARDYPEHAKSLKKILKRIVDLILPFQNQYFYHPAMKGSNSLKSVLPALVPELSYEKLPIGGGSAAMGAYSSLFSERDESNIAKTRADLLQYCKMDTYAMVKILERLRSVSQEQ